MLELLANLRPFLDGWKRFEDALKVSNFSTSDSLSVINSSRVVEGSVIDSNNSGKCMSLKPSSLLDNVKK
ncbi:MAG: hypothetical protein HRK26_04625 [Rickettsiaceae bacterium H1]|nr:hypothetical protein [Rickettsiaceae bacterium H1]